MQNLKFHPFPVLNTPRLQLRALVMQDDQRIFELRADPENSRYLDRPETKEIKDAQKFIKKILKGVHENEWLYWAIVLKETNSLIGTICLWNFSDAPLKAETGYELHRDHQGKGYMQEALEKVVEFGFQDLKLTSIEACSHQKNIGSIRLLEKNKFIFIKPIDMKMMLYELNISDFLSG